MTHDVIRHLLDDYVTGELTEDARAPVAEHVATCAICAAEVESLNRSFRVRRICRNPLIHRRKHGRTSVRLSSATRKQSPRIA